MRDLEDLEHTFENDFKFGRLTATTGSATGCLPLTAFLQQGHVMSPPRPHVATHIPGSPSPPAMARVQTQDGPKSETLEQAFTASSPAPSSNLPKVQPHAFESTTRIQPSQSGVSFQGSFYAGRLSKGGG